MQILCMRRMASRFHVGMTEGGSDMPNYVRNLVRMQDITKEPLFGEEDGKKAFDFNALIPMPQGMNEGGKWYDWSIEYWGTKWNALELLILDDNTIVFSTTWSNPEPIIKELAQRYPDRTIDHWWADEDMGTNTGHRRWENGEWFEELYEDHSQEALDTFSACWFMSDKEMEDFLDGD